MYDINALPTCPRITNMYDIIFTVQFAAKRPLVRWLSIN